MARCARLSSRALHRVLVLQFGAALLVGEGQGQLVDAGQHDPQASAHPNLVPVANGGQVLLSLECHTYAFPLLDCLLRQLFYAMLQQTQRLSTGYNCI